MEFVETPVFTKYAASELDRASYRALQSELLKNPEKGRLIRGTGGARKVRCASKSGEKSGGARIIYFYAASEHRCYMLLAYSKSEKNSLTDAQKNALRTAIKRNLK